MHFVASPNCVSECKTLEEKLLLNAGANDYNNDGNVTTADAVFDLSTNYDTDSQCIMMF